MTKRAGWGDHNMANWQTFFDQIHTLGQIKTAVKAEDIATNDLIAPANDFDKAKVKADADAYPLSDAFKAIDVAAVSASLFDQAVPADR